MNDGDIVKEYYLAGDPAKSHDYFGIVLLERIDDTIRLAALKQLQLDYTIVAEYIALLRKRYHFRRIFLDQTGIGTVFIDMLKAKGLLVEGITLSNPKKVEIVETVIRLMQEDRLRLPRIGAYELKRQLQEQERDLTQSGMIRFVHPSNSHDDLFWAFCIGCYGIKQQMDGGIDYMIVKTKKFTFDAADNLGSGVPDKPWIIPLDRAVHWPD
jgi:hypothetical protein